MRCKLAFLFVYCFLQLARSTSNKLSAQISPTKHPYIPNNKLYCVPSKGYIWSTIKNKCVQVWKEGIRLNSRQPVPQGQPVLSLFIIFNKDKTCAELFMPGKKSSTVLNQYIEDDSCYWKHKNLVLYPGDEPDDYILKDGNVEIYSTQ